MVKTTRKLSWIFIKSLIPFFIGGIIFLAIVGIFTFLFFGHELTSRERIMNNKNTGLVLLDRNNTPFFTFNQGRVQKYVALKDIPLSMRQAVISGEDKEFYEHPGFSLRGILRAVFKDVNQGQLAYGGSTITQQLVKISLLNSEKNFLRKYQEILLAQEIERRYSKDEILEMYLNSVYFGQGAFGVQEAAQAYFGKDVSQLTLAESTLLAGLLPSPSALDPITNGLTGAKKRQQFILTQMVDAGYITPKQKDEAYSQSLSFNPTPTDINEYAPHFAFMVRNQLIKEYGEEKIIRSGFKVKTTLNLEWQKYAEESVKSQVADLASQNVSNGAEVTMDPETGEILTLVGSADWNNPDFGKVNVATSPRQPGSSFKPIVYAKALEEGIITPGTILHDEPTTFPGNYKPLDYDKKFRGRVLPRRALANSLNIPAVEVLSKVGVDNAIDEAQNFGITTLSDPSNYGLSLVLGAGEVKLVDMVTAYSVFASGGSRPEPTLILSITDKSGNEIYKNEPSSSQVLSSQVAFIISSFLSDAKARAEEFGSTLNIFRPAAVKTGTTENYRDAWTIGYVPNLVVGVWVGNNDGETMSQIAGSLGAAPIWKDLMTRFLQDLPQENFQEPDGIEEVAICTYNGLRVKGATSSATTEFFLPGTEPDRYCNGGSDNIAQTDKTDGEKKDEGQSPTPSPTQEQPTPSESPQSTPTPEPQDQNQIRRNERRFFPGFQSFPSPTE